jgi:hypothetical protein
VEKVSQVREWLCQLLSKYCKRPLYEDEPLRYAKILMRMPPMRSWSLKSMENLVFVKIANNFDNVLVDAFIKKDV